MEASPKFFNRLCHLIFKFNSDPRDPALGAFFARVILRDAEWISGEKSSTTSCPRHPEWSEAESNFCGRPQKHEHREWDLGQDCAQDDRGDRVLKSFSIKINPMM